MGAVHLVPGASVQFARPFGTLNELAVSPDTERSVTLLSRSVLDAQCPELALLTRY